MDEGASPLHKRLGIEVELLAPRGQTRLDLAEALAVRFRGVANRAASLVYDGLAGDGQSRFSLRPSFDVIDAAGRRVAQLVDDITICAGLDGAQPSQPGWGRVVSVDCELLRNLSSVADLTQPAAAWLAPLTVSHAAAIEVVDEITSIAVDAGGNVLALATGLPGERERPAEVVSPPLTCGHRAWLDAVLGTAAECGFVLPIEAAVHFHFDAEPFTTAASFRALVEGFNTERSALRDAVGTNPSCRALGPWPDALLDVVRTPGFADLAWPEARRRLNTVGLIKHCDLNLLGVVGRGAQPTIEFRFFPGSMDPAQTMAWAELASDCLDRWAEQARPGISPSYCDAALGAR